jgi:hypothetical protein
MAARKRKLAQRTERQTFDAPKVVLFGLSEGGTNICNSFLETPTIGSRRLTAEFSGRALTCQHAGAGQ